MNKYLKQTLNRSRIFAAPMTRQEEIHGLIRKIRPMQTQHQLIRVGGSNDGGYLIPNDLEDVRACFSPGVNTNVSFEDDLLKRFNIPSHLADYSVDAPPAQFTPASFTKKFLGPYDDSVYMTMSTWVEQQTSTETRGDLILQMDIEGSEYVTILATPRSILTQFRVIVVEIHLIENWGEPNFFNIASALFSKLLQDFIVIHNHPNNNDGLISLNGIPAPRTLELTLLRKDRCSIATPIHALPHTLDAPNVLHKQPLDLPPIWWA